MPIITPPTVVQNAMEEFIAKFFTNQLQRDHVANYLTGLMQEPNIADGRLLREFHVAEGFRRSAGLMLISPKLF